MWVSEDKLGRVLIAIKAESTPVWPLIADNPEHSFVAWLVNNVSCINEEYSQLSLQHHLLPSSYRLLYPQLLLGCIQSQDRVGAGGVVRESSRSVNVVQSWGKELGGAGVCSDS
jgi:hypothetical protein